LIHEKFAEGQVTNFLGPGEKMYLAIAFIGQDKKISDRKIAPIQPI
jgi:DNA helicase-2/ATP-dependent DNA helicase PcrA